MSGDLGQTGLGRLRTVDEAAELLKQTPDTILRKIHEGQIEARRLGERGPCRISDAALAQHLRPVK